MSTDMKLLAAWFGIIGGVIGVTCVSVSAAKKYRNKVQREVEASRTVAEEAIINDLDAAKEVVEAVTDREEIEINVAHDSIFESTEYTDAVASAKEKYNNARTTCLSAMNYSSRKNDILADSDKKIAEKKNDLRYDSLVEEYNNRIAAAEKDYKFQKKVFKKTDSWDDIKDTLKSTKDYKVKEAEEAISRLDDKLEKETFAVNTETNRRIRELNEELNTMMAPHRQEMTDELAKLSDEADTKFSIAKANIRAKRTEEENRAFTLVQTTQAKYDDILSKEAETCKELVQSAKISDVYAYAIATTKHGLTITRVCGFGLTAIVGYLCYKFVHKVYIFRKEIRANG